MGTRILLADDSPTIQKVIELTFMDIPGIEFRIVDNGDDACRMVMLYRPSLVIADIHMPGRSGFEVAAFTKDALPDTRVLLLVGTFEKFDERKYYACGADATLEKPFQSTELTRVVTSLLRGEKPLPSLIMSPRRILGTPTSEARVSPLRPRPRVFLCHASQDKTRVRELAERLRRQGFDPWLDDEKLLPGQQWELEITNALREAHAVVVCLSQQSITKTGFVQKEIAFALDLLAHQPEGAIFLIPLQLESCDIPARLGHIQVARLHQPDGFSRLVTSLNERAVELGLRMSSEKP